MQRARPPPGAANAPGVPGAQREQLRVVRDKIWLDPARGWALLRREVRRPDGSLMLRQTNRDLKEVVPGVWLPMTCTEEAGTPADAPENLRDKVAFTRRFKVLEIRVNDLKPAFFDVAAD